MKVNRKWEFGHNYGYAGTDQKEIIDIVDEGLVTEAELEDMSKQDFDALQSWLTEMEWEAAMQRVDAWAHPSEEE